MTELEKFRNEYGPTHLGITRLILSLLTLFGGFFLSALFVQQPLWPVSGGATHPFTLLGLTVLTFGSIGTVGACAVLSLVPAWAWLGFERPAPFIQRVWRINWSGNQSIHCWSHDGRMHFTVVDNHRVSAPSAGVQYSLLVPLARSWGSPAIFDWVSCAPLGTMATGLSPRIVLAAPEQWMHRTDMVWLKDKKGNRMLVKLNEALAFWIPETLRQVEVPSLALMARKLHERTGILTEELAERNRVVAKAWSDYEQERQSGNRLLTQIRKITNELGSINDAFDLSRLRFRDKGKPIFARFRALCAELKRDPLGIDPEGGTPRPRSSEGFSVGID